MNVSGVIITSSHDHYQTEKMRDCLTLVVRQPQHYLLVNLA